MTELSLAEEIVEEAVRKKGIHGWIDIGGLKIKSNPFKNPEKVPEECGVAGIYEAFKTEYPELAEIAPYEIVGRGIYYLPWALRLARELAVKTFGMDPTKPEDRKRIIAFAVKIAKGMGIR